MYLTRVILHLLSNIVRIISKMFTSQYTFTALFLCKISHEHIFSMGYWQTQKL